VAGYTKMVYPQTVTYPSNNRAWWRVTLLIEPNVLPLSQDTTMMTTSTVIIRSVLMILIKHPVDKLHIMLLHQAHMIDQDDKSITQMEICTTLSYSDGSYKNYVINSERDYCDWFYSELWAGTAWITEKPQSETQKF